MDRSALKERYRRLVEKVRAQTAHLTEEEIEKTVDAAIREVRRCRKLADGMAAARWKIAAMQERQQEQLDDLKMRIDKRVERVKMLREQGLHELAARQDQVRPSELEEFAQLTKAIPIDPVIRSTGRYTYQELQDYLEFLRRAGCPDGP